MMFCDLSRRRVCDILGAMSNKVKRVFVGMSGGVDSSVAALFLSNSTKAKKLREEAGLPSSERSYDVAGVYLKCYVRPDKSCMKEAMDAKAVAEILGIPFEIWDFEKEYKKKVIDYMIDGYRKGLTPNPDILCNKEIKFGLFLEEALKRGADFIATGHYVRLVATPTRVAVGAPTDNVGAGHYVRIARGDSLDVRSKRLDSKTSDVGRKKSEAKNKTSNVLHPTSNFLSLLEARDKNKDQSYFLWTLTQEQLCHALFPIGDYLKSEVREIARKAGLPTAEKKDSQGVCFLGPIKLEDFLAQYIEPKVGKVELSSGGETKEIGEHQGAHLYTIGQRRGIGNLKHEKGVMDHEPLYVTGKDIKTNTVTVARLEEVDTVTGVELVDINIISGEELSPGLPVLVRMRYRQKLVKASVRCEMLDVGCRARLVFDEPQSFVASGQSAVFYIKKGDPSTDSTSSRQAGSGLEMLGGGVIV